VFCTPVVTIVIYEGRTIEQKRRMVKAVTDAIVQTLGPPLTPEGIWVMINEIKREHMARGGILDIDKKQGRE
jgi:4-oxalocrotonate tautomerase